MNALCPLSLLEVKIEATVFLLPVKLLQEQRKFHMSPFQILRPIRNSRWHSELPSISRCSKWRVINREVGLHSSIMRKVSSGNTYLTQGNCLTAECHKLSMTSAALGQCKKDGLNNRLRDGDVSNRMVAGAFTKIGRGCLDIHDLPKGF